LGLFRSDDEGRQFVQVSNGVAGAQVRSLAFHPDDARVLFATTPIGLLRSGDTGKTWARYGGGLPLSDIAGLAFGPEGAVFASDFRMGGIYRSLDRGESWAAVSTEGLTGERVFSLAADRGRVLAGTTAGGLRALRREPTAPETLAGGSR
jgi:photosystem II stability/assembly factor-like uncharacterized protein